LTEGKKSLKKNNADYQAIAGLLNLIQYRNDKTTF